MTKEPPTNILQIFRETLKPGCATAYKNVEDDTVRICAELKCPHPHIAIESLTGPAEVWWLNAFESNTEKQRVENAYAENRPLMSALEQNSRRKATMTEPPINIYADYRPHLSRGGPWTLRGARLVVVKITRGDLSTEGSVFEAADGLRYIFKPVTTRQQADAEVVKLGHEARLFAVRPYWGFPAQEWIDADPEFWKGNPNTNRE
jgi:hypothetical protein